MGVAAKYQVAALNLAYQLLVRIFGYLPAEVAQADDEVAFLLLSQYVDALLCCLGRVEEGEARAVGIRYQPLQLGGESEDANLQALPLDDDVRLHQILQHGTCAVVVGTHNGELCLAE